jgi:hypothetical protein
LGNGVGRPHPAMAPEEQERHIARDETPRQFFQLAQKRALRSARVLQNCVAGSQASKKAKTCDLLECPAVLPISAWTCRNSQVPDPFPLRGRRHVAVAAQKRGVLLHFRRSDATELRADRGATSGPSRVSQRLASNNGSDPRIPLCAAIQSLDACSMARSSGRPGRSK